MNEPGTYPVRPASLADLQGMIGVEIGPTEWHDVTQDSIDAFADATGDRQWIHVDPERAAASPLGTTIAHGLYGLSLGPVFSYALLSFEAFAHSLNYGYDKVRFPAPVPMRRTRPHAVRHRRGRQGSRGIQVRSLQTFECEGSDRPVVVAEALARVVEREA